MADCKEHIEKHIRFFYSTFSSLTSFREKLVKDNEYTILGLKNKLLKIDFCLGKPLLELQDDTYNYVSDLCKSYNRRNKIDELDMMDMLDALFFLIATKYRLSDKNTSIIHWLQKASAFNLNHLPEDSLTPYAMTYFRIMLDIINKATCPAIVTTDIKFSTDREFYALEEKNYQTLYVIIEDDLINANRMHSLYQRSNNSSLIPPIGYEDFSTLWYTLGKITIWQQLGIEIKNESLDGIFMKIFKKDKMFFDY